MSAYLDSHPDKTLDEAKQIVKDFLVIPDRLLKRGLRGYERYFSTDKFMSEASANGGVNVYIAQLLDELDSGTTHSFSAPSSNKSSSASGRTQVLRIDAGGLLTTIITGAAGEAGTALAGWALKSVGLGGRLGVTTDDITTLGNQIDDLKASLNARDDEMEVILKNNLYVGQVTSAAMSSLINSLENITDEMHLLAATDWSKQPANAAETERDYIISLIQQDIIANYHVVPDALKDNSATGTKSLIRLYGEAISSQSKRFFSNADSLKLQNQFDYFDLMQQNVLFFQAEYYHAQGETALPHLNDSNIGIPFYKANHAAQLLLLKKPIPIGTVIQKDWTGTGNSLMWYVGTGSTPPIFYTTYPGGEAAVATINQTSSFTDWRIPPTGKNGGTDWMADVLFGKGGGIAPNGSKSSVLCGSATWADLHAQGWPEWTTTSQFFATEHTVVSSEFGDFSIVYAYDAAACSINYYNGAGDNDGYYYDFVPLRWMSEGVETYLW